ncbi:MAG: alpha/beta hydrolase fold protein [Conexibacter sp.]|jgi:pimeloyl-ACP methyl ester carboxylesterase|nr:alpha/beta hydrolase fold protein [Conexibacter sp.]
MSERTIERDGVRLAVEDAGEGVPVVLLHGLTATRRYVVMGSRSLERSGHRVVSYDARGHGRSSAAPAPDAYGYGALADDLRAVLDGLGLERVVLAGASMGAHTLLRFALDAPERVAGLVVITPAFDPATNDEPARLAYWDRLSEGLRAGGIEGFVEAYRVEDEVPAAWRETVRTVLRQRMAQHDDLAAVADALHAVPRSRPFDSLAELAELPPVPAVVVVSRDEADPGHPLAVGEAYVAAIPGARQVTEEPGKSPIAWQGGQLSKVIAETLGQRPRFPVENSQARSRPGDGGS